MRKTEELTCQNPACRYTTTALPGGVNLSAKACPICGSEMVVEPRRGA